MTLNNDGFKIGESINSDDLISYAAKARQLAKDVPAIPSADFELLTLLANTLHAQKVRLKPLGLEMLTQAIKSHFTPEEVKETEKAKATKAE